MSNLFLDFHAIQAVGPANINRDDTGAPKSTVFGGTRRARVSSQAWKRAIRKSFEIKLDNDELGERTLRIVERIASEISEKNPELTNVAESLASNIVTTGGITLKPIRKSKNAQKQSEPDKQVTKAMLFLSRKQIEALADLAIKAHLRKNKKLTQKENKAFEKEVQAALHENPSIDIALFGRMIADAPKLNVDACCQVAHAIGVHPLEQEFDYFTAVDDNAPEDNAGAGMIGTVEFNASTLYRYATINVPALIESLGSVEAAAKAVAAFAESFAVSMPTGKQNTFANRTRPEFFAVSVRKDQPVNQVGAFEEAINSPGSRVKQAVSRLVDYSLDSDKAYGATKSTDNFYLATGNAAKAAHLDEFGKPKTLPQIVEILETTVRDLAEEE